VKTRPFKKGQKEYSLFPTSLTNPAPAAASEYCPFYGCNQTLTSQLRYECVQFSFEFIVTLNIVVSFYHTMAMKHCLEDDETERQLKCKI
jgi:hypothetical protein